MSDQPVPPIRVLLADDHPGVLTALTDLLSASAGFCVVAACHDGAEVLAAARATAPDIAVLDVTMADVDGITATRWLRAALPRLPVLVLTAATDRRVVDAAHAAGASGLVVKGSASTALPDQLRRLLAGEEIWPVDHPG